jgi:NAD(P)-dependent dehydrogenase (short-subunit alcohol dehydrogenase family)
LAEHPRSTVLIEALDVTDSSSVVRVIADLMDRLEEPRWVIANAGVGSTEGSAVDQATTMISTNLSGAIATIETAIEWFEAHPQTSPSSALPFRTVVGVSSVAGFRGLPHNPVYSAAKAGLSAYLEGRRVGLDNHDEAHGSIRVVDLAPGFIDTPMAGGDRPMQISAPEAAQIMADRIEAGTPQALIPPWPWTAVRTVMRHTPAPLFRRIVTRLG